MKSTNYFKFALIVILILLVIISIMVISAEINLDKVGDAFNGILGPFVGLFAAIIVYKSFEAQRAANKILSISQTNDENNRYYEIVISNILRINEIFKSRVDAFKFEQSAGCIGISNYISNFIAKKKLSINEKNILLIDNELYQILDLINLYELLSNKIINLKAIDSIKGNEIRDVFLVDIGTNFSKAIFYFTITNPSKDLTNLYEVKAKEILERNKGTQSFIKLYNLESLKDKISFNCQSILQLLETLEKKAVEVSTLDTFLRT